MVLDRGACACFHYSVGCWNESGIHRSDYLRDVLRNKSDVDASDRHRRNLFTGNVGSSWGFGISNGMAFYRFWNNLADDVNSGDPNRVGRWGNYWPSGTTN